MRYECNPNYEQLCVLNKRLMLNRYPSDNCQPNLHFRPIAFSKTCDIKRIYE